VIFVTLVIFVMCVARDRLLGDLHLLERERRADCLLGPLAANFAAGSGMREAGCADGAASLLPGRFGTFHSSITCGDRSQKTRTFRGAEMGEIKMFRDLHAWQVGMDTVVLTYKLTADFPLEERFGLVSQMRRASVSVPSNVAEGQAVKTPRWSLRHVVTAIGSATELETQLEAAIRLQFVSRERAQPLADSIDRLQKLLYGIRRERQRRLASLSRRWAPSCFSVVSASPDA
jgi:four helix bundle protein